MTRKLTCIICPRGCELTAHINDGAIEVKGNGSDKDAEVAVAKAKRTRAKKAEESAEG